MEFTYKPAKVYRGWWKVSDLPIGVEFRFNARKINTSRGLVILHNGCHLLKRISVDKYDTTSWEYSKSTWDVSDTSGPYIEIHII